MLLAALSLSPTPTDRLDGPEEGHSDGGGGGGGTLSVSAKQLSSFDVLLKLPSLLVTPLKAHDGHAIDCLYPPRSPFLRLNLDHILRGILIFPF